MPRVVFEKYKIEREMKRFGKTYTVYRPAVDKFNVEIEDEEQMEVIAEFVGLYHEYNTFGMYFEKYVSYNGNTRNEKCPMILCFIEDIYGKGIRIGDVIFFENSVTGGKIKNKVTGIEDICNNGVVANISLEVVDNGYVC